MSKTTTGSSAQNVKVEMKICSPWKTLRYTSHIAWPWGLLDSLAHILHLPGFIQRPICDRYDRELGAEEGTG